MLDQFYGTIGDFLAKTTLPINFTPTECVAYFLFIIIGSKFIHVFLSFTCKGGYDNVNANYRTASVSISMIHKFQITDYF